MLAREGDRTLVDARSGQTATLRELFAAAGANPDVEIHSVADALSQLEARTVDVPGLRVVRGAYEDVIAAPGLERLDDHGGSPAAAAQLPAAELRDVEPASLMAEYVADMTVADLAAEPQERFVTAATKGLEGTELEAQTERARRVWDNARRVATLSAAWER